MILTLVAEGLKAMAEAADGHSIQRKRKAITALFPYAVWRERDGQHELLDIIFHLFRAMVAWARHKALGPLLLDGRMFMWCHIEPFVTTLLIEESPDSLKQAIILASPYIPWEDFATKEPLIQLWAAAASTVPYTDDIGQSMVDTLLRIANDASPRPIPAGMWSWLNKRPPLPPVCWGRFRGSTQRVARAVRTLGDTEILKSYLLLIWSEWDEPWWAGLNEMCASLREDFNGIGMEHHRQDLLRQLDNVLGRLDLGPEHPYAKLDTHLIQRSKKRYGKLREVLREVDRETTVTLIRELPRLILLFSPLTTADVYRASLEFYVFTPTSMSIIFRVHNWVSRLLIVPLPVTQLAGAATAGRASCHSSVLQLSLLSSGSL